MFLQGAVPLQVLFRLPWLVVVLMVCPHVTVKHLCLVFAMCCCFHCNNGSNMQVWRLSSQTGRFSMC